MVWVLFGTQVQTCVCAHYARTHSCSHSCHIHSFTHTHIILTCLLTHARSLPCETPQPAGRLTYLLNPDCIKLLMTVLKHLNPFSNNHCVRPRPAWQSLKKANFFYLTNGWLVKGTEISHRWRYMSIFGCFFLVHLTNFFTFGRLG